MSRVLSWWRHKAEWWVTLPSLLWLGLFFLVPSLLMVGVAFKPADPYGGIGDGWTLNTVRELNNAAYPLILWRTLWLSLAATTVTLLFALPMAYWMARLPVRWRNLVLLLVILPFWTNFLIRVFAWKSLLHPEGPFKKALAAVGLVSPDALLLYNVWAVLVVLIYTSLPFAILPLYAAAEKFDFSLLDAARDLGAGAWRSFMVVFIPGVGKGLLTAILMVLIPAMGAYAIPDIVGGVSGEMIGNKIAQRVFSDRNLPHAAALALLLAVLVLVPLAAMLWFQRGQSSRTKEVRP